LELEKVDIFHDKIGHADLLKIQTMKIVFLKPVSRFGIEVRFDDGAHGIVDLADIAGRGVFSLWLKEGGFESVKITGSGALEWPGELDLCPDSIYMRLTGKTPEQVFPILKKQLAYA
jgi:hypothetical protein